MHSFWGQGELNSWCLFTITPFWKLTLTNVNIELPCVIIALALEDWPSLRYVITLLRTLFCKQYFFSRTVTLLRYYERFSVKRIFLRVDLFDLSLLHYCERLSYYLSRPVTLNRQLTPLSLYLLWGIAITLNRSRVTLTVFIMRYSYHT